MIISEFQKHVDTLKDYGQNGYGEVFPAPTPPKGGESYQFPSESELLSDDQVDDWFLFLGAWIQSKGIARSVARPRRSE